MAGKPRMEWQRARGHVKSALKAGLISKPDTCERCGQKPVPGKDGRSRLHGHHHDHAKHLEVEWLCALCHRAETPSNPLRGLAAVNAKLTDDAVRDIRTKRLSQRAFACEYSVSQHLISLVQRGRMWTHV
jgi:hypothetical protein